MKQKVITFFLAFCLFAAIGSGNVYADYSVLEKDETISTHAKGNENGYPPSVLPPQC
jgi:hypothetical protein